MKKVPCTICNGTGKIFDCDCPMCAGSGFIHKSTAQQLGIDIDEEFDRA